MTRLPVIPHSHRQVGRAHEMAPATLPLRDASALPEAVVERGLMRDRFGRRVSYLRLSVTDRCNLRCHYCVPVTSGDFLAAGAVLTDDEIVEIVATMARCGLEKVRLTGGEPLVRPGILDLIDRLRAIPGLADICLSTNGVLRGELAEDLVRRGVGHVNVSVDSLDPGRFREVTRGGDLARIWRGIERLLALGAPAVKLNAVLMRGVNDGEVADFARLTYRYPIAVRFIELMPLAHCGEVHEARFVPATAVLETLRALGGGGEDGTSGLEPVERGPNDGPARSFRLRGALGTVGVITAVSEREFCERCNRVRLSADGQLKLCLFGDDWVDLRAVVRARPRVPGDLEAALARGLAIKPEHMRGFSDFTMMSIGG